MSDLQTKKQGYWAAAAKNFTDLRMICIAAVVVALRVALRLFRIPVGPDIYISFDCFVNSVGSMIYGPLMALAVGGVSDTLGAIMVPQGPYFFPFIFTEMSSSFIFALFLWRRKNLSAGRIILSRFTVNLVSNLIITSAIMKWLYYPYVMGEGAYPLFNTVRIAKNIILFPLEGTIITVIIFALAPALSKFKLVSRNICGKIKTGDIILIVVLFALSGGLVVFYASWLAPFLELHKIVLF